MAKSKEELNAIRREYEALSERLMEQLADEDLGSVAGGSFYDIEFYENESDVQYLFNVGDIVEVKNWFYIGTVQCRITDRRIVWYETYNTGGPGMNVFNVRGYRDEYYCQEVEDHWYFSNGWNARDFIEK